MWFLVASPGTTVSLHGTNKKFSRGLAVDDCISSPWSYQMTYVPMFFSALQEAERTGHGAVVEVSLQDAVVNLMRNAMVAHQRQVAAGWL